MKTGIIADDNTGATDAAGMLTSFGAKAVLLMNPEILGDQDFSADFDAVVVGTRIRSVSPAEAIRKTSHVVGLLKKGNYDLIQLKYCSTFDSTREGNIGQSLDAAREVLGFPSTPVCPALPVNGRTTYMGYHFVGRELLSESPLSRHPLNPMTDAKLPRWLGHQTETPVGLIDHSVIRLGAKEILHRRHSMEEEGILYHVTDALVQEDIDGITEAYEDTGFLSGGSGISASLGRRFFQNRKPLTFSNRLKNLEKKMVIISGSESPATARQKETAIAAGFQLVTIHPLDVIRESVDIPAAAERAFSSLREAPGIIITPDREKGGEVKNVHAVAGEMGLTPVEAGEMISDCLGRIAAELLEHYGVPRILVAGGETSGAVCHEAGFDALEVGLQIDPGVPYCFPVGLDRPMVILKSGNFGGDDLFARAGRL